MFRVSKESHSMGDLMEQDRAPGPLIDPGSGHPDTALVQKSFLRYATGISFRTGTVTGNTERELLQRYKINIDIRGSATGDSKIDRTREIVNLSDVLGETVSRFFIGIPYHLHRN